MARRGSGFISSTEICKACVLLKGLNDGRPKMAIKGKVDMFADENNVKNPEKKKQSTAINL